MTTPSTARKAGPFAGNGSTTAFPFTFKVFAASDLRVTTASEDGVETVRVLGTDYSVALNANQDTSPGGTVTYPISGSALPAGSRLVIGGNLPYDQPLDLPSGGNFSPLALENQLDRAAMQIQQLAEGVGRALQVSPTTSADVTLPAPEAGKVIAWNGDGTGLANVDSADLASVVVAGSAYTNVFSGNGTATQFVLTADPGNVNALDVAISGVSQVNGADFTVSGTTLTFTSAPPAGTGNIAVRYVAALPVGAANAQDVTFLQSGAGATSRTVAAKLREVVSVKDFGAVGDGVADDTTAIQIAANAAMAARGVLWFPPNNAGAFYKTTASIVFASACQISGAGPQAVTVMGTGLAAGTHVFDFNCVAANGVEDVAVRGLTLRSNTGLSNGLRLRNVANANVDDVRVFNVTDGVTLEGTRCYTHRFSKLNAVAVSGKSVVWGAGFTGGGQFIFESCAFLGNIGVYVPSTALLDNLSFFGCNFEQCSSNSLVIYGSVAALNVSGSRTEGCDGIDFVLRPVLATEYIGGVNIAGNVFSASDAGAAARIRIGGDAGKVRGFNVTGNVVTHGTDSFSGTLVALNGDGESGVVAGNYLRGTTATVVDAQRAGVVVFGNENMTGKLAEWWGLANGGMDQGTWTPVDGSGAGLTFTAASGRWTRSGRMVFWQCVVTYPTTASGAAAEVGGLPFAVGGLTGNSEGRAGARVDVSNVGSAVGIYQGLTSSTELAFVNPTSAATISNATLSGKTLYCSGTYTV